jgi:hypothetical protein
LYPRIRQSLLNFFRNLRLAVIEPVLLKYSPEKVKDKGSCSPQRHQIKIGFYCYHCDLAPDENIWIVNTRFIANATVETVPIKKAISGGRKKKALVPIAMIMRKISPNSINTDVIKSKGKRRYEKNIANIEKKPDIGIIA